MISWDDSIIGFSPEFSPFGIYFDIQIDIAIFFIDP